MYRFPSRILWGIVLLVLTMRATSASEPPAASTDLAPPTWHANYGEAFQESRVSGKMLLVYFHDEAAGRHQANVERLFRDPAIGPLLDRFVLAMIPVSTRASSGGEEFLLLGHAAFAEMKRRAGMVIIDHTDPASGNYGRVVSVYPFSAGRQLDRTQLAVLLNLPTGSLTQRTLIFAVRTHPDRPSSSEGRFDRMLAQESQQHCHHQAQITVQGHHNWDRRFHRINARLPRGMVAQEVCAESWPGQDLVDAATECVASWRQSSGHWSAVSSRQSLFGFDMQRGRNGVWYATGIFARGR